MAKLSNVTVVDLLNAAKSVRSYKFIIEVVPHNRGKFAARIKGRNGKIVMPQENVDTKQAAQYIAARLIDGGLSAKYVDRTVAKTSKWVKP